MIKSIKTRHLQSILKALLLPEGTCFENRNQLKPELKIYINSENVGYARRNVEEKQKNLE